MSRSFYAMRSIALGVLTTLVVIGGFPGIAAACEGIGIEEAKFAEEKGPRTGTVTNPFAMLKIEVIQVLKKAAGEILGGTCKAKLVINGGGTCTIIQDEPVGAGIEYKEL